MRQPGAAIVNGGEFCHRRQLAYCAQVRAALPSRCPGAALDFLTDHSIQALQVFFCTVPVSYEDFSTLLYGTCVRENRMTLGTCRYCTGTAVLTVCSVELGVSSPFDDAGFVPVLYWKSVPRQCVSRILCKCIWGVSGVRFRISLICSDMRVPGATAFPLLESQLSLFSLPLPHPCMSSIRLGRPFPGNTSLSSLPHARIDIFHVSYGLRRYALRLEP